MIFLVTSSLFSMINKGLSQNIQENPIRESQESLDELSADFIEVLNKRTQFSRHFYNASSNTFRYLSDQLVYQKNIIQDTNWVTLQEFPIKFLIRLTNSSIYKFSDISDITNFFTQITNNSLWGIGIETYNGLMGFYTDFSDSDWGHGQYLYYPRLTNGKISNYDQPLYAIYPHLFVKDSSNWYDELINNRTFYSAINDPRDHFIFDKQSNEYILRFQTDFVKIQNFHWNISQGFKYNTTTNQFHIITEFTSLNRSWDDIGLGYEITASPQAVNTQYEPDNFLLTNGTHSKLVNITSLWEANETILDPLNTIDIISQNGEAFKFNFDDMKNSGFTQTYLELHNQILPNKIQKKTLLAGMYGYGNLAQNELISIDPTFSEKQIVDAYDFWIQYDSPSTYDEYIGGNWLQAGYSQFNSREEHSYEAWNTTIFDEIDTISNGAMTWYIMLDELESGESVAGGLYDSTDADHIFSESEANGNESTIFNWTPYYEDLTFITDPSTGNYSITSGDINSLLDEWKDWHNTDPSGREYLGMMLYNGTGQDYGTNDFIQFAESSHGTVSWRPTLTFDYTLSSAEINHTQTIIGTVTILGNDPIPPIITSIVVSDNLTSPFDQVAYDSSQPIIWYSNVKSFDSVLNITVTATDNWGLESFNTSTEWNDGTNVTVGGVGDTQNSIQFNYTISNGETSSGNVTLEVYDTNDNKDEFFINATIDNTVPNDFTVTPLFDTVHDTCAYINTTVTDDISGINGIGITIGGFTQNFTSIGINEFCGLTKGTFSLSAQAYDQVGNLKNATNNGMVYLQVDVEEDTETITGSSFDPLDLVEIVLDEIYMVIIIIFIGLFLLVIFRRMVKQ
jgi:hypothetical protein